MSLQRQQYTNGGNEENFKISILLNNAMNNLNKNDSEMAVNNINEIRKCLNNGRFSNYDQQDAQEFLTCLLQQVTKEMDKIQGKRPVMVDRTITDTKMLNKEVRKRNWIINFKFSIEIFDIFYRDF